jgi:hypothetical protein
MFLSLYISVYPIISHFMSMSVNASLCSYACMFMSVY